ncbi:MAG: signal peptide peptidase SppA [Nitrospiraceae bacterium]|nr:signal peptide peptidase SppA [Nitrospiraceae bacterium]
MSKSYTPQERHAHPILVALATIGGLSLLGIVAVFLMVAWMARGVFFSPSAYHGDKVGVVTVKGVIADPEATLKVLRNFQYNKDIKAVVVRINSPGGAVGASQELYEEIRRLDQKKPVVASLGTVAASGGYYTAIGARYIVADPGTVTGSIGVIAKIPNVKGLMEKIGVKTTVVKCGSLKDLGSITRDMTKQEHALLQNVMEDVHQQFIEAVAKSRKLPEKQVSAIADGRIMTGNQAFHDKLVDKLGNFSVAIDQAAKLAGIKGRPELVYPTKNRLSVLREILRGEEADAISNIFHQVLLKTPINRSLSYETW